MADVIHPIIGSDLFQDGEGKRCTIYPRRRCRTGPHLISEMNFPEDEICRAPSKQEQVRTWSIVNKVPGPTRRFTRHLNSARSG